MRRIVMSMSLGLFMLIGRTTVGAGSSNGLLAYYPFNANADDESGNGNHGTVVGATLTTDRFGNEDSAYSFDGNDSIWVADNPAFTLGSDPFTIATWMQFSQLGSYYMLGHDEGEGNRNKWIFWVYSSGFQFFVHGQSGSFIPIRYDGWLPEIGRWYHLAIVRDGDVYTQYIDGAPVQTATHSSPIPDPNTTLQFGTAEGGHPERVYRGLLDEIRIYNRALTRNQLAELAGVAFTFEAPDETPTAGEATIEAKGDFDRDGWVDVAVVLPGDSPEAEGDVQVFRNLGNDGEGVWSGLEPFALEAVGKQPSGIAVGNFDSDDFLDIAVSNANDDDVSVLLNDGTGAGYLRTDIPVGDDPSAIAAAFIDDDDLLDLVVANRGEETVYVLAGDGTGGFDLDDVIGMARRPRTIDPADLDNDKDIDLVFANEDDGTVGIARQDNGGFLAPFFLPVGAQPVDVVLAFFNRDDPVDLVDIATANAGDGTVSVIINQGGGVFDPALTIAVGAEPTSVDAPDLDLDLDSDLVVVATDPEIGRAVQVLKNVTASGGATFGPPVAYGVDAEPNFVVSADVNRDLLLDLVTANTDDGPTGGSVSVLLNAPFAGPVVGDANGDGCIDFEDILVILAKWGVCPPVNCPGDLNFDGVVDFGDILPILGNWAPCV